jgi:hypothetical protein
VLKTLGFGDGRILSLVLLESVFIAFVGGGLGLALSYTFITVVAIRRTACCRHSISDEPADRGVGLVLGLGLAADCCPRGRRAGCASSTRSGGTDAVPDHRGDGREQSIDPRAGSGLRTVAIIGIAGVVLVFVAVLSIAEGVNATMKASGDPNVRIDPAGLAAIRNDERARRRVCSHHRGRSRSRPRRIR